MKIASLILLSLFLGACSNKRIESMAEKITSLETSRDKMVKQLDSLNETITDDRIKIASLLAETASLRARDEGFKIVIDNHTSDLSAMSARWADMAKQMIVCSSDTNARIKDIEAQLYLQSQFISKPNK